MSHFTVVVFTKDRRDPAADVERLLAPFDENQEGWDSTKGQPFWDWWSVGGRWDGRMLGLPDLPDQDHGFHFAAKFHTLERNACEPKDIDPEFVPFGFVTPDGDYHSNGTMGWWAQVDGAEDEDLWKQKWAETKGAFADCLAVLTDCHI